MTIDSSKPYNKLPLLPATIDLKDQEILLATIEANDGIARLNTMLKMSDHTVANTLDLLSPLFVPEAVSSSGVENIVTTNNQVYIAKISEVRELKPAEKEVLNYTDALMVGISKIVKKGFLNSNDFIELQKIIEPKNSGLRKLPGTQLKNPTTGKVYYTPPEGDPRIRDLLKNFEIYFNSEVPSFEVFSRMAILHYQFEAIHPFYDANGRTGRIIMPLYLMKHGRLSLPLLFISSYILDHRDEYYKKIRGVTYDKKWKDWIIYIINATTKQAYYTCEILEKIHKTMDALRVKLKNELPGIYSAELVDFLFSNAYFTRKMLEEHLRISYVTTRKYLEELERKEIIVKRKQTGANRYLYVTPEYLNILQKA